MILTPHITEAGASPAIYDTQSLENEFKDFDDNKFLKDIKKSERSQAEAKIKAQQKELAKEMKELQKEFGDDKTKAPQSGSMRDRVNQILNEDNKVRAIAVKAIALFVCLFIYFYTCQLLF